MKRPTPPHSVFRELTGAAIECPMSVKRTTAIAIKAAIDQAKHVYEFDLLFNDIVENDIGTLRDAILDGKDIIREFGVFRFPQPACWITWREKDEVGAINSTAVFVDETPDEPHHFAFCIALIHIAGISARNAWQIYPGIAHMKRNGEEGNEITVSFLDGSLSRDDSESMDVAMRNFAGNVLGLANLLARPGSTVDVVETTAEQNRFRGRRELPPLPPRHRVIDINRVRVRRPPRPGTSGGSPKSAHDRRAHERMLSSGKRVQVRCCTIKGGNGRLTVHEVRDSSHDVDRSTGCDDAGSALDQPPKGADGS